MGVKSCKRCKGRLPLSQFGKDKARKDGISFYCLACNVKLAKIWRQSHPKSDKRTRQLTTEQKQRYYQKQRIWLANNRDRSAQNRKRYYATHKAQVNRLHKKSYLKTRYNLTLEEYSELMQVGCMVCYSQVRLHIDHDHKSGVVRGVLCSQCNTALGLMQESPERFQRAILYLVAR